MPKKTSSKHYIVHSFNEFYALDMWPGDTVQFKLGLVTGTFVKTGLGIIELLQ